MSPAAMQRIKTTMQKFKRDHESQKGQKNGLTAASTEPKKLKNLTVSTKRVGATLNSRYSLITDESPSSAMVDIRSRLRDVGPDIHFDASGLMPRLPQGKPSSLTHWEVDAGDDTAFCVRQLLGQLPASHASQEAAAA